MATHSSVLAWRIPGTGEPGGLPSMESHRVRHDWSDLAAAAAARQAQHLALYRLKTLDSVAKTWKQSKCPSTDEWIKKIWRVCMCVCVYIYTHIYIYGTEGYVCVWLKWKESACNARDVGLISGLGRSPGEGNGNPLQYSCLENSMDRGSWLATVHGVSKCQTLLSDEHTRTHTEILLSHKKERNNAICSDVDGLRLLYWVKSERERQIPYDITYMWNLKYDPNELIYERETDSQI